MSLAPYLVRLGEPFLVIILVIKDIKNLDKWISTIKRKTIVARSKKSEEKKMEKRQCKYVREVHIKYILIVNLLYGKLTIHYKYFNSFFFWIIKWMTDHSTHCPFAMWKTTYSLQIFQFFFILITWIINHLMHKYNILNLNL